MFIRQQGNSVTAMHHCLTNSFSRIALALLYGGLPTPLLTKLGPALVHPSNQKTHSLGQNSSGNGNLIVRSSRAPSDNTGCRETLSADLETWEADELERIDRTVLRHLGQLAGRALDDSPGGEEQEVRWKVGEHWSAFLHWLHLDLDLGEVRQGFANDTLSIFPRRLFSLLPRLLLMALFLGLFLLLSRLCFFSVSKMERALFLFPK